MANRYLRKGLTVPGAALAALAMTAGCTIAETPAPPLTGPSGYALSLSLAALPDLITRDGFSQSVLVVTARDPNGAPVSSLQVRLDMLVNGQLQDFGMLSTKTLFTGSDGRAIATYTAPPPPAPGTSTATNFITVIASPVGTNQMTTSSGIFGQSVSADIRLVLPTTNNPTAPIASFRVISPASPKVGDLVKFDGIESYSPIASPIVNYAWNWGDGEVDETNAGPAEDHDYASAGTYRVTLTVTDSLLQQGSITGEVTVSP